MGLAKEAVTQFVRKTLQINSAWPVRTRRRKDSDGELRSDNASLTLDKPDYRKTSRVVRHPTTPP
jgi:hypothetical protein